MLHSTEYNNEEQLKHLAGILMLKDTGTKLDLLKVILVYLSPIIVSTQEGIDILQATFLIRLSLQI